MKFGRAKDRSAPRQRLKTDESAPKPTSFKYSGRRSEEALNTGRQMSREETTARRKATGHYWLQRSGLIILLIAAMLSAANILSLSSKAKVLPLVSGQDKSFLRDQAVYETAAQEVLSNSIWNRNKITVNTGELSRELTSRFPELTSIGITIPLLAHRPLIYVQVAQPALMLQTANGVFIIDTTGKALLRGDTPDKLSKYQQLPLLNDQSGLKLRLGRPALPAAHVSFIQNIHTQLAAKNIAIAALTLPTAANELHVQPAGQPYIVKFNLQDNNPRRQAGTFLATLERLQQDKVTPAQYIDVRVAGRAYYQ